MEISSSTLPAVAAERATMFVALELSKSSWLVALHSPVADRSACMTRHPPRAVGAEPGRTWTGSPQGSDLPSKRWVPSASTSRLPQACGMWVPAPMRADRI